MVQIKKDVKDIRSYFLRVRLNIGEVNKIRELARQKNMTISKLVRTCVLGDKQ